MTIEIEFCGEKAKMVSFINPDNQFDRHRYHVDQEKGEDAGPWDDNAGIEYEKVVIDFKNRNWRIAKYPKDHDSYETYKYLPHEGYVVNVISLEKCTNCKKHEEEAKNVPAVFVSKQ